MYDPRTLHSREVLERVVEAFGDDVLETVIGRTVKFPDASVSGVPITQFAPEHAAAQVVPAARAKWSPVAPSPRPRPNRLRPPSTQKGAPCSSPASTARSTCC
ncbi:ParA family protein [Microbacterium paulum]